ncbi:MAG TPA: VOC family protein [Terriglobia bacterium]|nr:VOC family protein [Terriglobia bacterium]
MTKTVQKRPEGFHTVNPYLVINGAARVMEFLKQALDAVEVGEAFKGPDGKIMHATMRIGDSMVELGDSPEPMAMNLHVYVDDVDTFYRRAIEAGGVSVREPETTFYGDRSAGVKDPGGNKWWLSCHVEDVSSDEIVRRATQRKS